MIGLVASTAALAGAAALFAAALPRRGALMTAISVGLIWYGLLLATLGIAGLALRALGGTALTLLSLGWLVLALGLARWRGLGAASLIDRARATVIETRRILRNPSLAIAALLVLGTLAWRVFLALRLPVVDYDGWSYHLVFGDVWIQHEALTLVPQRIWTAGYPADGELLTTWLMAFTHSDAMAGFTSILPIPIAIVAVTGLARALGASLGWSMLAGLVFSMTPALVAEAGTSYRDAASVAFPVATWWLGLRVIRGDRSRSTVALLGLAAGIAVGTKGTNVALTAPVLVGVGVVLLLGLWRARAGSVAGAPWDGVAGWLGRLVLLGVPFLALGAVWYLRDWAVYGNPLYPFAIGPWHGPTTLEAFALHVPQLEPYSKLEQIARSWAWDWKLTGYLYNVRPGGIGRAWFLILAAGILGGLTLLRRRQWAALGLVVAPAIATFLTMPMPWYARETLFVPALATALAGVGASAAVPTARRLASRTLSRNVGGPVEPWPVAAHLGALAILGLAGLSLLFVNARPNIAIRDSSGRTLLPVAYLRYVLADDATRADVSLRKECAGFGQIPVGSRVMPGNFNLLHGIVGPDLDRILTDPLPPVADPAALLTEMQRAQATWLVTADGTGLDRLAAAAGQGGSGAAHLADRGVICRGGHLWQLVEPSG